MLLAASTRSAPTSPVDISEENRVKTASGLQHAEAAKDTSVPAMRTSAPRWVASGPSRRAGTGVMFELSADEDVDVWRKRVRPVLTVRCSAKETEVFVVTQSAASIEPTGQHTVQVSFDDGGAAAEMWEHSVDHDALFAPNGKGLLHQIAAAHRMSFSVLALQCSASARPFQRGRVRRAVEIRGEDVRLEAIAHARSLTELSRISEERADEVHRRIHSPRDRPSRTPVRFPSRFAGRLRSPE